MGVKEALNKRPWISGVVGVIAIGAAAIYGYQGIRGPAQPPIPTGAYFTTDDGKTWFADDANRLAPFTKDGKEAVKALVFSCNNGKDPFVGYLEKLTPAAKQRIEAIRAKGNTSEAAEQEMGLIKMAGTLTKKPGAASWMPPGQGDTKVSCPGGDFSGFVPVNP